MRRRPADVPKVAIMSRPIELSDVVDRLSEYGPLATLITVTPNRSPHVGTVLVTPHADCLHIRVGGHTREHIRANPSVSLAWLRHGLEYQLIVDGTASVADEAGDDGLYEAAIEVRRGILHRIAGCNDGPSCRALGG